jgi:hypothetical protein
MNEWTSTVDLIVVLAGKKEGQEESDSGLKASLSAASGKRSELMSRAAETSCVNSANENDELRLEDCRGLPSSSAMRGEHD